MENNLIGISGKIKSGKDTVGKIIQYLDSEADEKYSIEQYLELHDKNLIGTFGYGYYPNYEIKKFGGKLKQICSLLTGIPVEKFEDQDFKNKELGEEWWYWKGSLFGYVNYLDNKSFNQNVPLANLAKLTPRLMLQLLGTECGRDIIHPNVWINALFADYKSTYVAGVDCYLENTSKEGINITTLFPDWIITDVRFPNEVKAIKERGGIIIRVNRNNDSPSDHFSETALDNFKDFDYIIDNNGTLEELVIKVKTILF